MHHSEKQKYNLSKEERRKLIENAKDYFKTNIIGQTLEDKEVGVIQFRRSGMKKITSFSGNPLKVYTIKRLKEILPLSHLLHVEKDWNKMKRPNIKAYYKLMVSTFIYNNAVDIYFVLREDDKGIFLYDFSVKE